MKRFLLFTVLFTLITFVASAQWVEQATGFTTADRGIRNISIVDADTVWVCAEDGSGDNANVQEFSRTIDGGNTWTPGTFNLGNTTLGISMIHAINATKAYIAVYKTSTTGEQGIYLTVDTGNTWTRQTTADFQSSSSFTNVVYFFDENNGFCMGDPVNSEFEVYTTIDGGTTWVAIDAANIPDALSSEYGYSGGYAVSGNDIWFSTNKGRLYHSADKGYTWTVNQTPVSDFGNNARFAFSSSTHGIIIDKDNKLYGTNNGTDWSEIQAEGHYKTGLAAVPGIEDTYVSTGSNDGVSFTNFAGYSWTQLGNPGQLVVSQWFDGSTGWAGSFSVSATQGGIFKFTGTIPNPFNNDLAVTLLNSPSTEKGALSNSENIKVTITNQGRNSQSNFDVSYSINGGATVTNTISSTLNGGESLEYSFTNTEDFSIMGDYNIKVATLLANDENTSNDTLDSDVYLYYPKNILHEQFTTEGCSNCPKVLAYMDEMREKYPNLITITHHSGFGTDWLSNDDSEKMLEFYNDGGQVSAPAGMFDRHYNGLCNGIPGPPDPGPVFWDGSPFGEKRIISRILPGYVSVNISGSYNESTKVLTMTVSGDFVKDLTGELSINVWLTEDHIAPQNQSGAENGFEHRFTQRKAITKYRGNLLQNGASVNDTYTKTYTDTIDDSWVKSNMYIVAFIGVYDAANPNNREVYNVNQVSLSSIIGISETNTINFNIYPNPTKGMFNIEGAEGSDIEVLNSLGQVVYKAQNVSSFETIDLSNNNIGTYFVRVKANDNIITKKIVFIK